MYFPEFSITNNILKSIGKIEASEELIKFLPMVNSWQNRIKRESELQTIFHIIHFDNPEITFEQVKTYLDGKNYTISLELQKLIDNTKMSLDYLLNRSALREDTLKIIHSELNEGIMDPQKTGLYRTAPKIVENTNIITPTPDEILAQIRSFTDWLDSFDAKDLHPAIISAIVYYEIIRIQPFDNKNKMLAGLLALLNLYNSNYDRYRFIDIEQHFDRSPTTYYTILKTTQSHDRDLTKWIEYFLSGMANKYTEVKDKLISLSKDNKIREIAGMTPLNERQEKIIEYLQDYGHLQNKDFAILFPGISEDTTLRDLKDLTSKGLLIKIGKTKSSRYELKKQSEENYEN